MRFFRKIKRKFSKECKKRFEILKDIRIHRCWLYSARDFAKWYFYSNCDFEEDFKELSKLKATPSYKDYRYRFVECRVGYLLYRFTGVQSPKPITFNSYCVIENSKQFRKFWDVYEKAPFWKKYKVWLKKQEINKDFNCFIFIVSQS